MAKKFVFFGLLTIFACSQTGGEASTASAEPAPQKTKKSAPKTTAVELKAAKVNLAAMKEALATYEEMRKALAADKLDMKSLSAALSGQATKAKKNADATSAKSLQAIADAAKKMGTIVDPKGEKIREQFGEISRPLVAIVRRSPELQKGRFLFHCPMAQNYEKWFQLSDDMANPYMGTRMLKCGSKRTW